MSEISPSSDLLPVISTLPVIIQISVKSVNLAQKSYFYLKTTNKQS